MRRYALLLLLLPGCLTDAPPVDDVVAEEDSSSDGGESEGGEESSSSGDVPADPLDAYGPCDVDADCPLIPGDKGELGESPRCVLGTCAIRCAQAAHPDQACPGWYDLQGEFNSSTVYTLGCNDDGYCTIFRDYVYPYSGCPDGMISGDTQTVPDLSCVWPQ
jgi:hypothetical protein